MRDPVKKLFWVYALLIVYFSLYPLNFSTVRDPGERFLPWQPLVSRTDYLDTAVNVAFYLPFGALGALAWNTRGRRWWQWSVVAAGGAALSFVLETAQVWVPGRYSSARDLLMNALGAVAGVGAGALFSRRWMHGETRSFFPVRRPVLGILAAAWLASLWFPFLPITRLRPLYASIANLGGIPSGLDVAKIFVSCLLLTAILWDARARSARRWWTFAAFLAFPLRLLLRGAPLSWLELAAAALAFMLGSSLLPILPGAMRWLAGAALLVIVAQEFFPFALSASPAPFYWVPFTGFLESNRDDAIRVLSAKFFLYGSAVWSLKEAGLPLAGSAGIVTLLLSVGEATQRYLPGRIPESTDPLLALLAALVMYWLKDRPAPTARPGSAA